MGALNRQGRIVVAALGLVLLAAVVLVVRGCGGEEDPSAENGAGAAAAPERAELPGGGRVILPGHRVVAAYGAPQDEELGMLGVGTPREAGRRLMRIARRYERLGRDVMPAMELIAVVANAHAGTDGLYRTRQSDAVIRRYLRAARRIGAILILDVQPGRSDFLIEARSLRRWLREPDVSLALDPEWRVDGPEVPGQVIGSVSAREVNAVSYWLEQLVAEHDLPQKLLLIHRFTEDMIAGQRDLKDRDGIALAINVDGFGGRAAKRSKYEYFASGRDRFHDGFKLFFREDIGLMTPRQVLRLRPAPDIVVYE